MNDFISMMACREETLKRIIKRIHSEPYSNIENICWEEGLPFEDLTLDERNRVMKEINIRI